MAILSRLRKKKTIGFWAGDQNNFQFVNPLIKTLSKKYNTVTFDYDGDVDQLIQQVESVDVAWFEWGNGPVVPASQRISNKPMINRIHRYEVYSESPDHIKWDNISSLLFSSPSMIEKFKVKFPKAINSIDPVLLPIGVDTELFSFSDKERSKEVIYIGRLHPHKEPALLLQILSKLIKNDPDFHITIIGSFHDELYEEYFNDQLIKQGLTNNVSYHAHMPQAEIVDYLKQADYFIITSIIEGLSQASLEAMACGAVPVIFDYYGAEKAYPQKYIYRTVDEAVDMMLKPRGTRQESRDFIENKYLLSSSEAKIVEIIEELLTS